MGGKFSRENRPNLLRRMYRYPLQGFRKYRKRRRPDRLVDVEIKSQVKRVDETRKFRAFLIFGKAIPFKRDNEYSSGMSAPLGLQSGMLEL